MLPEDEIFIINDINKSRDELLELVVALRKQILEYQSYKESNSDAMNAMSKDYKKLLEEVKKLRQEKKELSEALASIAEKEQLKTNEIFGRGTEKLSDAFDSVSDIEIIDEAETETITPNKSVSSCPFRKKDTTLSDTGKVRKSKTATDLSKLPSMSRFLLDIKSLNETHGEGNWRIVHWRKHTSVEHRKSNTYVVNFYSPVISIGLEHHLETVPYKCLLQKSFVSASLMAEILYEKFFMAIPFYRLEQSFRNFGLNLARQNMCNWFIRFAFEYFSLIVDRLNELMMSIPYHQCDETTLTVINDGRKAGSKSYVWVHITSELLDTHPIIMFCYELTRGTDHLRKFYKDFEGYITCDAYCSYQTLAKEKQNIITICGCAMHMRRRFFQSLLLIKKDDMTEEDLNELPEAKALSLISEIYDADEKLKALSAAERKEQRDLTVRPLVEAFYSYIDSIDEKELMMRSRLKDAVNYAKNQKEFLCRFLDDGNIPIDDGATERHIRPFAVARNSFMFCNTIDGAEALAIMYTIVETAKANHSNVYLYLRYILEEMPRYMEETNLGFVDKFLPWSEEYLTYERYHSHNISFEDNPDGFTEKPRTPRKKDSNLTELIPSIA